MGQYNSSAENEVMKLRELYGFLLDEAPTFAKYKELEISLEKQIKTILGVPAATDPDSEGASRAKEQPSVSKPAPATEEGESDEG